MAGTELLKKRRIWKDQNGEVVNEPTRDWSGTITSGGNPNYTYIEGDTVNKISSHLPTLPTEGEYVGEKTYNYNGDMVKCRQGHYRTIYDPIETPALFSYVRKETTETLEWIMNEQVEAGDKRLYNGKEYECLKDHQTQEDWTPEATLGNLWGAVSTTDEWQVGVAYEVGDVVTYNGTKYSCLQAHTSQQGWEPPNVPALFDPV